MVIAKLFSLVPQTWNCARSTQYHRNVITVKPEVHFNRPQPKVLSLSSAHKIAIRGSISRLAGVSRWGILPNAPCAINRTPYAIRVHKITVIYAYAALDISGGRVVPSSRIYECTNAPGIHLSRRKEEKKPQQKKKEMLHWGGHANEAESRRNVLLLASKEKKGKYASI